MISEKDLLDSYVHFDPPLYSKRAKKHEVYLIPSTGSILKGRFKGITLHKKTDKLLGRKTLLVDVPSVLQYDNRPEYEIHEFPIRDLTRETLGYRIREAFEVETRRISATTSR